ncbi:MAG: DNA-3-methyladenine glycosylase [archaeon]|nr:DNA-3-methyladenine glycosylase [archaeon]
MKPLPLNFFNNSTAEVAKALLGCYLVNETPQGEAIGKIVETEAYLSDDPASHSSKGITERNKPMFSHPGTIYIYFTYGMYHCFNIATREKGIGEAVLIRALEPIKGLELMKKRRKTDNIKELCNGPAKLVQALDISKKLNNSPINSSSLKIFQPDNNKIKITTAKRIGISKGAELPLRFFIKDNKFVSKP